MLGKVLCITGFFDAIGDFLGGVCSAIGSAISSIGSAIASLATSAVRILGSLIGSVCNLVKGIGQMLGIFKKEDDMEEMGYKAMNSDLKPEDFESHKAYVEALRNQPLKKEDKEKLKNASLEEKLAYQATSVAIGTKSIEEEMDMDIPLNFFKMATLQKLGPEDAKTVLESYKEDNNLKEYSDYYEGRLDGQANVEADEKIVELQKELNPELSEKDIFDKITEDKESMQNFDPEKDVIQN